MTHDVHSSKIWPLAFPTLCRTSQCDKNSLLCHFSNFNKIGQNWWGRWGIMRSIAIFGGFQPWFSHKVFHTLDCLSYDIDSKCAGKLWPWRIEWCVQLVNPTVWSRHGGFWSKRVAPESGNSKVKISTNSKTSKVMRSAPNSRIS